MKAVEKIRSALGIHRQAVGVKYTDEEPPVATLRWPVRGLQSDTRGRFRKGDHALRGDLRLPRRQVAHRAHRGEDNAAQDARGGEKLWSDVKTATRSRIETQKIAIPPVGLASRVYFYSADQEYLNPISSSSS